MQFSARWLLILVLFTVSVQAEGVLRVAFTGSSITWGDGLLDDSFVGEVDKYLRTQLASTIVAADMNYSVEPIHISNPKFYGGKAIKITGIGNSVSFSLKSDSLSIVQGMERSQDNASIIELYVDGKLYDTFSNYNPNPVGSEVKEFTGDGNSVKFDLGRCYTYAHKVTVDGILQIGGLNTAGYGATFPPGQDYLIIRKYVSDPQTNQVAVHHVLLFSRPPKSGAKIRLSYNYGENIGYTKTTVGELELGFDSKLESRYGDDNLDFAPSSTANISSGLDFRFTDERAIKTWNFAEVKERHFEFRIRGLDERAAAAGTPYFIINFATDRMHRIMNAGIGGWTAERLATDQGLRNIQELIKFQPDIILFESGTNDDWSKGRFVCTRKVENLTEVEISVYPSLWLKSLEYHGEDNYSFETYELIISEATEHSIAIQPEGVDFGDLRPGDILIIGDYYGDDRTIQCRIIESWDAANCRAQFTEPLKAAEFLGMKELNELVGKKVRVKRIDDFIAWMQKCVEIMQALNPHVAIGIIDTGLCNFYTRTLLGYPEKLEEFCQENGLLHIKSYKELKKWQYSQMRNITAYLGPSGSNFASGKAEYHLVDYLGQDIHQATGCSLLRNWSVKVNGQEVYGTDCYIVGGQIMGLVGQKSGPELEFDNWHFPRNYKFVPTKLVFFRNIPEAGSRIEIKCSSIKWSSDDTHPNRYGAEVYGKAIIESLPSLQEKVQSKNIETIQCAAVIENQRSHFSFFKVSDSIKGAFSFPGKTGLYSLKVSLEQENLGTLQFLVGGRQLELALTLKGRELVFTEPVFINRNDIVLVNADGIIPEEVVFSPWKQAVRQEQINWEDSPFAGRNTDVVLIQAEDYVAEGGGICSYLTDTHMPRYGSGIMNWGPPGHWLEWEVYLPKTGKYLLFLGAATTYPQVIRKLTIDGAAPHLNYLEFTSTGGWGRSIEQWGNFLLHDRDKKPLVVELKSGTHRLRLTSIYNYLNLDYIAFYRIDETQKEEDGVRWMKE